MNELLEILKEAMPKVDWENGEDLVDDGIIDSMDVVTIISEITDAYDIEIPSEEMEPENFNSAQAIYEPETGRRIKSSRLFSTKELPKRYR